MANANVMAGASRLKHAIRTLQERWRSTAETWNDSVRRRFADRYIQPMDPAITAALIGMQKMGDVLDRVRRDCSDRSEAS